MSKTHFASTRLRCSSSRGLSSKASLSAHWWQGGHGGVCMGALYRVFGVEQLSAGYRYTTACTTGVQFDRNGGSGIDAYPLLYNCDFTGASNAWSAVNCAAGTVFPVLAGNKGGICTMVGTVAPDGVVTAMQGCEYIWQNGDSTTKHFKSTGTGSTGWSPVTIP